MEVDQASRGPSGKQVPPWRARARRRHLPACLAGTKQLAGTGQHSAGPPGGPAGGFARLVSFLSLFLFSIYSVLCFEIVKILFHLGKP